MELSALSKLLPMRWRHAVLLRRERDRTNKLVEAARLGGKSAGEIHELYHDLAFWEWSLEDERADCLKRKLRREADRLHVGFPSYPVGDDHFAEDENWRHSMTVGHVLTTAGVARVRKEIREERTARRERFIAWAPVLTGLVTALIGLLGVVVALVAVWRSGS